ncbi:unnamed protein product, partial [marine sediment metagenome]
HFSEAETIFHRNRHGDPHDPRYGHLNQVERGLRHGRPETVYEYLNDEIAAHHYQAITNSRHDLLVSLLL